MTEMPGPYKARFEAIFIICGKKYELTNKRNKRRMRVGKKKRRWERNEKDESGAKREIYTRCFSII